MLIKGVARGFNQLLGSGPPVQNVAHPCFKRLNTNALLSEEVRRNFQRTLNHQLEELSKPTVGPSNGPKLTAEWKSITDTILSTARSTLGVMHKRHQDWFDASRKQIHVILHEKNSAYKAHLQQPKSAAYYQPMDQDSFPSATPPARDAQYIDLSKAFDTIDRVILWKTLSKFGCPPIFLAILWDFHDDMSAQVMYGGASSEFFFSAGWCQTELRAGTCHLQHLHD